MNKNKLDYLRLKAMLTFEYPDKIIDQIYTSVDDNHHAIPNVVYQTWETNKLGRTHYAELRKFREMNMDYSFEFYDNAKMDDYMREHYEKHDIYGVYKNAKFGPLKTDIWRYCILFQRGGVYFDINKYVDIPLKEMISADDRAVISFEKNVLRDYINWEAPQGAKQELQYPELIILNWGLAFAKGHVFLGKTIQNIVKDYELWKMKRVQSVKNAIVRFTGPLMFTRSVWQAIEEDPEIDFEQAGIDFYRHGNFNQRGSWSRHVISPSYTDLTDNVIVS
jgi:mannosyltransferase OCH1-like enzyme